ncbi:MAG: MBL fold metallo-hydrolase [Candidatus Puniceispirillales bacterium WSBS_2018_MAG_OTU23]
MLALKTNPINIPEYNIPEYGQITKLASDVYWARFALPFRLNHINLYIFDAGDSWTIIDCGLNVEETANQWVVLLAGPLAHQPIDRIIVSHHHVDHIGYAGRLAGITGGQVFTSADEYAHAKWLLSHEGDAFSKLIEGIYTAYGFDESTIATGRNDPDRYRRYVADLPPITVLNEGDIITSRDGGWRVRIDGGHSSGHISLYDEGRGIYLAVDFLLPRISPNVSADFRKLDDDQLGLYLGYLADIQGVITDDVLVLPGHDWPFRGGKTRAAELIVHHQKRLDQLRAAAAITPLTTASAMDVLFGRVFGPHEVYFAAGEARAHLNHLVAIDCMEKSVNDGVDCFHLLT